MAVVWVLWGNWKFSSSVGIVVVYWKCSISDRIVGGECSSSVGIVGVY